MVSFNLPQNSSRDYNFRPKHRESPQEFLPAFARAEIFDYGLNRITKTSDRWLPFAGGRIGEC